MILRRGQCVAVEKTVFCCGEDSVTNDRRRGHCITEERTVCY